MAAAGGERLPDGLVTMGQRDIAAAWLTGPSRIYGHGVLGDAIEATGLAVKMRDGRDLSHRLRGASVFEDRRARLADLDGDGRDEIIVVRSCLARGAALAVFRVVGNRLEWVTETPPIGMAHRWLNPAGVADFDGDGRLELALVVTPILAVS
ncbi:MAG: VCBS repeat-containing protein [Alphaproteobacteria bacterium]|nr:VCBS repeat-containing protein [Alphaproteobacteria bacterium]